MDPRKRDEFELQLAGNMIALAMTFNVQLLYAPNTDLIDNLYNINRSTLMDVFGDPKQKSRLDCKPTKLPVEKCARRDNLGGKLGNVIDQFRELTEGEQNSLIDSLKNEEAHECRDYSPIQNQKETGRELPGPAELDMSIEKLVEQFLGITTEQQNFLIESLEEPNKERQEHKRCASQQKSGIEQAEPDKIEVKVKAVIDEFQGLTEEQQNSVVESLEKPNEQCHNNKTCAPEQITKCAPNKLSGFEQAQRGILVVKLEAVVEEFKALTRDQQNSMIESLEKPNKVCHTRCVPKEESRCAPAELPAIEQAERGKLDVKLEAVIKEFRKLNEEQQNSLIGSLDKPTKSCDKNKKCAVQQKSNCGPAELSATEIVKHGMLDVKLEAVIKEFRELNEQQQASVIESLEKPNIECQRTRRCGPQQNKRCAKSELSQREQADRSKIDVKLKAIIEEFRGLTEEQQNSLIGSLDKPNKDCDRNNESAPKHKSKCGPSELSAAENSQRRGMLDVKLEAVIKEFRGLTREQQNSLVESLETPNKECQRPRKSSPHQKDGCVTAELSPRELAERGKLDVKLEAIIEEFRGLTEEQQNSLIGSLDKPNKDCDRNRKCAPKQKSKCGPSELSAAEKTQHGMLDVKLEAVIKKFRGLTKEQQNSLVESLETPNNECRRPRKCSPQQKHGCMTAELSPRELAERGKLDFKLEAIIEEFRVLTEEQQNSLIESLEKPNKEFNRNKRCAPQKNSKCAPAEMSANEQAKRGILDVKLQAIIEAFRGLSEEQQTIVVESLENLNRECQRPRRYGPQQNSRCAPAKQPATDQAKRGMLGVKLEAIIEAFRGLTEEQQMSVVESLENPKCGTQQKARCAPGKLRATEKAKRGMLDVQLEAVIEEFRGLSEEQQASVVATLEKPNKGCQRPQRYGPQQKLGCAPAELPATEQAERGKLNVKLEAIIEEFRGLSEEQQNSLIGSLENPNRQSSRYKCAPKIKSKCALGKPSAMEQANRAKLDMKLEAVIKEFRELTANEQSILIENLEGPNRKCENYAKYNPQQNSMQLSMPNAPRNLSAAASVSNKLHNMVRVVINEFRCLTPEEQKSVVDGLENPNSENNVHRKCTPQQRNPNHLAEETKQAMVNRAVEQIIKHFQGLTTEEQMSLVECLQNPNEENLEFAQNQSQCDEDELSEEDECGEEVFQEEEECDADPVCDSPCKPFSPIVKKAQEKIQKILDVVRDNSCSQYSSEMASQSSCARPKPQFQNACQSNRQAGNICK